MTAEQDNLMLYKRMPNWTAETMPDAIKQRHNTKIGTYGKLTVLSGQIKFVEMTEQDEELAEYIFTPESKTPFVQPQAWHRVEALTEDLEFYLEFYCLPEDYLSKKYNLTKTHSEVIEAAPLFSPKSTVLDLGCGQGRNSLYLSLLGHQVKSVDANGQSLTLLEDIALEEGIPSDISWYDINEANLTEDYDVIISTVVFMFLNREQIPAIIANIQEHTKIGGYNLIVCAMDTENYPCPMPFRFTFKEGELADYYKDWELVKYNENPGQLHKVDENGNRIKLQFATMLAKKKS